MGAHIAECGRVGEHHNVGGYAHQGAVLPAEVIDVLSRTGFEGAPGVHQRREGVEEGAGDVREAVVLDESGDDDECGEQEEKSEGDEGCWGEVERGGEEGLESLHIVVLSACADEESVVEVEDEMRGSVVRNGTLMSV